MRRFFLQLLVFGLLKYFEDVVTSVVAKGLRSSAFVPRKYSFYGRDSAQRNAFPYVVIVNLKYQQCTGALIRANWVLSSANCLRGANQFSVAAGTYDTSLQFEATKKEQHLEASSIFQHPDFRRSDSFADQNDLALIYLAKPFSTSGEAIGTIEMANDRAPDGQNVTVAAWDGQSTLQELELKTVSWDECHSSRNFLFPPKSICAYVNTSNICPGDDGSPVVYDGKLVGMVSFVRGTWRCKSSNGKEGLPLLITSIPHYQKWIMMHIDMELFRDDA